MYNEENCPNHVSCRYCKYYDVRADMDGVVSKCKRIDHKKIKFAIPWFKSYDCDGMICNDFDPKHPEYADFKEWTTTEDYMDVWYSANGYKTNWRNSNKTVSFTINGDTSVRYNVRLLDYFYGTMFDGKKLKAVSKMYYKQTRANEIGYKLITEEIDGVDVE